MVYYSFEPFIASKIHGMGISKSHVRSKLFSLVCIMPYFIEIKFLHCKDGVWCYQKSTSERFMDYYFNEITFHTVILLKHNFLPLFHPSTLSFILLHLACRKLTSELINGGERAPKSFIGQQEIYQAKLWLSLIVLFHTNWKKVVIPLYVFDHYSKGKSSI